MVSCGPAAQSVTLVRKAVAGTGPGCGVPRGSHGVSQKPVLDEGWVQRCASWLGSEGTPQILVVELRIDSVWLMLGTSTLIP